MRPVLLEIDGFASYRSSASVDFRDADFFVLVGPTGSGKSTVIDAMIFALYGTVPRWEDRAAVAPALAPTANRAVVQLIFDVGGKRYVAVRDVRRGGGKTQAVTVKEARLEQYLSPDATGADGEGTIPLASGAPKVTKAVEALLGLTFEQFTQSVALPQGEFARFLHATDGDRQQILKDLLGYGVYDKIGQAANVRAKDGTLHADLLAEQLTGYLDATPENVASFETTVRDLGDLQQRVSTQAVPALTAAIDESATIRTRIDELSAERAELLAVAVPPGIGALHAEQHATTAALSAAAAEEARIAAVDTTLRGELHAAPPRHELERTKLNWDEFDRIVTDLPALAAAATAADVGLSVATRSRDDAAAAVATARTASADADRDAEQSQRDFTKYHTALTALRTVSVPDGLTEISQRIRDTNALLVEANTALTAAEAAQQSATEELQGAPDAAALASAVTTAAQLTAVLAEDSAGAARRRETAASAARARDEADSAAQSARAAEAALHHAERADAAGVIRSELHVGDDCLVCGQLITILPARVGSGDVGETRSALHDARATAEVAAAAATHWVGEHSSDDAVHIEQLRRADLLRHALLDGLSELGLSDHVPSLQATLGVDSTEADQADAARASVAVSADLLAAQRDRSTLEQSRRTADLAVITAREALSTVGQDASLAQQRAVSARGALRDARDAVSTLAPPVIDDADVLEAWNQLVAWTETTTGEVTRRLDEATATAGVDTATALRLRTHLAEADSASTAATDALTAAALTKQSGDERLHAARLRHGELTDLLTGKPALAEVNNTLAHVIALQLAVDASGVELTAARTATEVARRALTAATAAIETSWQELRRVRDPLTRFGAPEISGNDLGDGWQTLAYWSAAEAAARLARTAAAELLHAEAGTRIQLAERTLLDALTGHDISAPVDLTGKALGTQALTLVAAAVATSTAALTRARERLSESGGIRAQMTKAIDEANVAKALANLMRSNQFPRWLIASALDTLLDDASLILMELSGGQFELTRDDSDLRVVDHNDADMSRLVKTLSGGETFQASLALALALSKQVTSLSATGASKLESIFLDEGFGTLDETTLDVVASTLENLASSGSRMVGVITHVAALAEGIPVRYQVIRDTIGSHIERQHL